MQIARKILFKIFLVLLLVVLSGEGMLFILAGVAEPSKLLFSFGSLALLGLLAGFLSRFILRGHTSLLRLLVALLAVMLMLQWVNWRTSGSIGLDVLSAHPRPDWDSLIQLGVASLAAWLMTAAWSAKKTRPEPVDYQPPARVAPVSLPEKPHSTRKLKLPWFKKANPAASGRAKLNPVSNNGSSAPRTKTRREAGPAIKVPKPRNVPAMPRLPKLQVKTKSKAGGAAAAVYRLKKTAARTWRRRKVEQVKLVGKEQHRCPYCLEEILPNDKRGVKICPICRTHHHADCWELTGVCQVPHQQN